MQRALLLLLFAASYLLFAGALPWTLAALLVIAAVAALVAPRRTFAFPPRTRPLDVALLALIAAVAIQILPLPTGLVSLLSPHAADIRSAIHLTPLGATAPSWTTLSVHPQASLLSLGTVALGVLSFWIARAVFDAGGSTRLVCKALTLLGTLAALMAVIQKAIAPRAVLFLIEPEARSASPFGAFVNRNHFAGWLLLLAAPVAGYCVTRLRIHPIGGQRRWRESFAQLLTSGVIVTILAVMVIVGVLLVTLSRSALAGLACAALVAWRLGQPRLRIERTTVPALLGLIGCVLVVLVLFVDVDRWATRFEQTFSMEQAELGRLTIWQESMPIVKDFWLTGTGAGTYSNAMTVYQKTRVWVGSMRRWAHFNNAHSFYLQVVSEGGLLVAIPALATLLALAALGWRALRADKGEMFWVRVGAAAGLAGFAAQSLWEIALIMPANAVLAGILAGLLLNYREGGRGPSMTPTPTMLPNPPAQRHAAP